MTPDLKRLCEAAWKAEADGHFTDHLGEQSVDDACDADRTRYEAIVRAVLMALRETGDEPLAAAAVDLLREVTDPWDCMPREMDEFFVLASEGPEVWGPAEERIRPHMKRAFGAMLNAILAEPAASDGVVRDEDGDVLVPSGVSAEVRDARAFISGPAPSADYIVGAGIRIYDEDGRPFQPSPKPEEW